jgi:predicted transposase/invertase (TIGR01784 family)
MVKKSKNPKELSTLEEKPAMPHDGVFKKCLSDLTVAEDFLRIHLPAEIQQQLDFSTLSLSSGSFVDEDIKQYCSDIVYSLKSKQGEDCYIYCLVEHQSTDDPLMPFRMLRYCLAVMQRHIDRYKTKQSVPLVVPLLFYHGQKRPYPHTHKMRFVDCFENVKLAERLYHGPFPLVDITIVPDEEILTHRGIALLEAVLKHIWSRDLLEEVGLLAKAWAIANPKRELARTLMYYMWKSGEVSDEKALIEAIIRAVPSSREDVMTIAQKFEQRGEQRGRLDERFTIAKNLLGMGVDPIAIKQATHLSDEEINRLRLH